MIRSLGVLSETENEKIISPFFRFFKNPAAPNVENLGLVDFEMSLNCYAEYRIYIELILTLHTLLISTGGCYNMGERRISRSMFAHFFKRN